MQHIPDFGLSPTPEQISLQLECAADKHGIPGDLLKALAWRESNWDPRASSFDGGRMRGVLQLDQRTHSFAASADVWNPARNIDYGAHYLRMLYDETCDWDEALRRFRGGKSFASVVRSIETRKPWRRHA